MTPYSHYFLKQAEEGPTRPEPKYRSATETGFTPGGIRRDFIPPKYYERPGINPELAAQGKQLEADYARQFPGGDYTYSSKGWGYRGDQRAQMDQDQIDLRNRFKLYEAQALGAMPNMPQAAAPSPSATSAFIGDLARSPTMPTSNFMYAYDIGTKGLRQATADRAQADAQYYSMLGDAGKRVANRYGANFELQHPNDELLDWSSYALEAAPTLLAAAVTGGQSVPEQFALRTAARAGAPSLVRTAVTRGFQPLLQGSKYPAVRYVGETIPAGFNFALSSLNPIPPITGAASAAPGFGALPSVVAAQFGLRGATNNFANAYRDTAAFNAANPNASLFDSTRGYLKSLAAGGVALDPTSVTNRYGIGVGAFAPAMNESREEAITKALQIRLEQLDPKERDYTLSNPVRLEEMRNQIASNFADQGLAQSMIEPVAGVAGWNPFRSLGARSYAEDLEAASRGGVNVAADTMGVPLNVVQDPRMFDILGNLGNTIASIRAQEGIGDSARQDLELAAFNSSRPGQKLLESPLRGLVGGDLQNTLQAAQTMTTLNLTLAQMHQYYAQTGQVPPGFNELAQQAELLTQAQQLPVAVQQSGNTPFLDAVFQSQATIDQVFQMLQSQEAPQ